MLFTKYVLDYAYLICLLDKFNYFIGSRSKLTEEYSQTNNTSFIDLFNKLKKKPQPNEFNRKCEKKSPCLSVQFHRRARNGGHVYLYECMQ